MIAAQPGLLFDADVLIKLSVLDCYAESVAAMGLQVSQCATLLSMTKSAGIDRQEVRERRAGPGKAARRLYRTLAAIPTIDRLTTEERTLAVEITGVSQAQGLFVDGGEAMLIAISLHRNIPLVATGDKKAIRSLPELCRHVPSVSGLKNRIACLEHLLIKVARAEGFGKIQPRLWAGRSCDTALSNILNAADNDEGAFYTGMHAKLAQLRATAGPFLLTA